MRRFSATLSCAVLAVGLAVPGAAAATPSRGDLLLAGQLTGTLGTPSGETLTLYAWPSNRVLDALPVGESIELVPIGRTTTDARGRFEVGAADVGPSVRGRGEPLNVSVAGASGADRYWFAAALEPAAAQSTADRLRGSLTGAGKPLTVAPLDSSSTETDDVQADSARVTGVRVTDAQSTGAQHATDSLSSRSATGDLAPRAGFCSTQKVGSYQPVPAQVGATFVHSSGATADYQFTAGATSTLGVGISSNGRYGSFGAGGISSLTSGFTLDYATTTKGSVFHRAFVVPQKFHTVCVTPDGIPYLDRYEVRATSYTGGSSSGKGSSFATERYCTPMAKGTGFTKNSTRAITWGKGLQTAGPIGINLSSQSGFTSDSKLVIRAGKRARQLCGHHAFPGSVSTAPGNIKVIDS